MTTRDDIKRVLDEPAFWLLVRKFAMSPAGPTREQARQALLDYIAEKVASA